MPERSGAEVWNKPPKKLWKQVLDRVFKEAKGKKEKKIFGWGVQGIGGKERDKKKDDGRGREREVN